MPSDELNSIGSGIGVSGSIGGDDISAGQSLSWQNASVQVQSLASAQQSPNFESAAALAAELADRDQMPSGGGASPTATPNILNVHPSGPRDPGTEVAGGGGSLFGQNAGDLFDFGDDLLALMREDFDFEDDVPIQQESMNRSTNEEIGHHSTSGGHAEQIMSTAFGMSPAEYEAALKQYLPPEAKVTITDEQLFNDDEEYEPIAGITVEHDDAEQINFYVTRENVFTINDIYMKESARGKGHAKKMIAGLVDIASRPESNIPRFELEAAHDGRWVWLKFTFTPNDVNKHVQQICEKLASRRDAGGHFDFLAGVSDYARKNTETFLGDLLARQERGEAFNADDLETIAGLNGEIPAGDQVAGTGGTKMAVGHYILKNIGPDWHSTTDLWQEGPQGRVPSSDFQRLRDYLGLGQG